MALGVHVEVDSLLAHEERLTEEMLPAIVLILNLLTQQFDQLLTMRMHVDFFDQSVKPKIPGRLVHSLFPGERNELLQVCRQQTHVSAWSCNQ